MPRQPRKLTDAEISKWMREDPWAFLELPETPATKFTPAPVRHSFGSGRRGKQVIEIGSDQSKRNHKHSGGA
jgi:hypothetical protein